MSVTRHHADWLSLVEVSGPFISLPVLMRAFPQGLEPRDPAQAKALRAAYEEWQDNPAAPGKHHAWVMHVLSSVLGYPPGLLAEGQRLPTGLEAQMLEFGETLRPDFALLSQGGGDTTGPAQLLISSYPAEQSLNKPVIGKHWKATPATRMMELLHGANVPLGLVTNGEHWMLVYAPRGETTGYASWYGALWLDEPITLRAFHSVMGVRRFFGVAADSTLLALLKESASDQQEVTDQLGYQVREAVEVLVQSFDALDKESKRETLKGIQPTTVYDAALTIMMRLVFLFSAEERGLLHLGKPLYDDNYAVSTLQEQLQEVADRYGEEVLERRYDAWARLLATFRAVHGGIQHQDLLMQAYGGSLFDPDRYPFLEGRAAGSHWRSTPAEPLAVNNRVVLHLLNSLQRLRTKVGAGGTAETRRVSFRALGVEQIGHIYEGLLDHTAYRASEVMIGIRGTRKNEPEIALSTLEGLLRQSDDKLLDFLKEETGRSLSALRRELKSDSILDEHKLLVACDHDEALLARLRPFAGLIREDSFECPWVVLPPSIFVTEGAARRSTGTHYTPPALTEPVVQHTLEPLVYVGPAEGLPKEQWKLKSPKEILDLKVCDMAMGSGAFLVQACRYLADRLVEAWENEEKTHPGQVLMTPDGKFSEGSPEERLVPAEAAERVAIARRVVADRCLYGVDINPMAVEMAKLSMWLITVDANRPFTFLDHAFKCGDSLLGITSLDQLENFNLRPGAGKLQGFNAPGFAQHIEEAKQKREMLEAMPSDTPEQIADKATLYLDAEDAIEKLRLVADILLATDLKCGGNADLDTALEAAADQMLHYWSRETVELVPYARRQLGEKLRLHWPLEFPEIFSRGGFDAFIGNPPFLGGTKLEPVLGLNYRRYLVDRLAGGVRGSRGAADLCAYFFLRAMTLCRRRGFIGFIATNSIGQGDSAVVGLARIIDEGSVIYRAVSSIPWPGAASMQISLVWLARTNCGLQPILDGQKVPQISAHLSETSGSAKAHQLRESSGQAFEGVKSAGLGFVLEEDEAIRLLSQENNAALVLRPYLNGVDVNRDPTHRPSRWIINFRDLPLTRGDTASHVDFVASDFPNCLAVVEERVKPERLALSPTTAWNRSLREKWWQFGLWRPALKKSAAGLDRVLVSSRVTAHHNFCFVPTTVECSDSLVVITHDGFEWFAIISSTIHAEWAHRPGATTLETRLVYLPTWAFATFPFPTSLSSLENIGQRYYQHRERLMIKRSEGLTKTYNRFHDPESSESDIVELRLLHTEMDQSVAASYGWQDLDLGHGFHETKQGIRFTISEAARREVLDRLLALNHQRHAEEVAAAATQASPPPAKRGRKKKDTSGQMTMDL